MKKISLLIGGLMLAASMTVHAANPRIPVEISAEGDNRFEDGIAYASGNVIILFGDDVIYCDEARFDQRRREVTARGNVSIYSADKIYRGEHLIYQLDSKQVQSLDFRGVLGPLLMQAREIESPRTNYYKITDGMFTTENRNEPAYRLQAGTIEIYPNDRVVMKNVAVYVGPVPVFWFPYVAVPLDDTLDNFDFTLGASSRWGFYGLGSYRTALDSRWAVTAHGGYRSRRGFGGGIDLDFNPRPGDQGELKTFVTQDMNPAIGMDSRERRNFREPNDLRYRAAYRHRYVLGPGFTTTADLNVLSDRHVVEDFFPSEFRLDQQPDNFFDFMYHDPNFTVTLLTRFQTNYIFNRTERKPELLIEFKRQDLFGLPISYEGESSVVNFARNFDRDDPRFGTEFGAVRYDTFHQLLYPRQYFDWLSLTPRAGVRGTAYTRNNDPTNADPAAEVWRYAFNLGLEASFKVSRTWNDVQYAEWGVDGLRHVLQPYTDISYIPRPNRTPDSFRGFDNRYPNTRLQPLYFPAFNSIDSINEQTAIRHGMRNKLQTLRDGENVDLIDWDLYAQANINRSRDMGVLVDEVYSHIYNELHVKPLPWLSYELFAAAGIAADSFHQIDQVIRWQLHPALELNFSHRFLDGLQYNDPAFPAGGINLDNGNRLGFGSFWRLNESWKFSHNWIFEATDGRLHEQRYEIFRDLRAWTMSLGAAHYDNRGSEDELMVYMTLTLKAFPQATLSIDN